MEYIYVRKQTWFLLRLGILGVLISDGIYLCQETDMGTKEGVVLKIVWH